MTAFARCVTSSRASLRLAPRELRRERSEGRSQTGPTLKSPAHRHARGFTLVELMVVVVIIGLLAALALPAFQRVKRAALGRRYFNDVRQIRDGAERYALEHGNYPPNGIGGLHTDLRGYVPDKLFNATTPLGGTWDWDYAQNGFTASVSVYQFTASDADLRAIDQAFDDGDLNAGTLRKDGSKFIYVLAH